MAATLKLPFARFIAQTSSAPAQPKATYKALASRNALALQSCEWRDKPVSEKACLALHDFKATHLSDAYDAYLMTGNYDAAASTEIAYAGMAAYRFTLPAAYLSGSQTLVSMSLPIVRDRFLLPGVRVVAVLSNSASPDTSWSVVHGDSSPAAVETEYLKNSAENIRAAYDASGTLELDLAGADTTKKTYLWIYLTVEDYTATWTMYSEKEARLYAIEGSAMIVGEDAAVTFSASVTPDETEGCVLLAGNESPTWLQPPVWLNSGTSAPAVPNSSVPTQLFVTESSVGSIGGSSGGNVSHTVTANHGSETKLIVDWNGTTVTKVTMWAHGAYYGYSTDDGAPSWWKETAHDGGQIIATSSLTWTIVTSISGNTVSMTITDNVSGQSTSDTWSAVSGGSAGTPYYVALSLSGTDLVDAWICTQTDGSSRVDETATIGTPSTASNVKTWSLSIGTYFSGSVKYGTTAHTLRLLKGTTQVQQWNYDGSASASLGNLFDAIETLKLGTDIGKMGVAASLGDFSSAIATYDQTKPDSPELLMRLVRMSKNNSGGMASAYVGCCALADELDVLRPVPRHLRQSTSPSDSDIADKACQPGLSVWYRRPPSASSVQSAVAWRSGSVAMVGKVSNPVTLQYTYLALRSPGRISSKLVLENDTSSGKVNKFSLRFVVWRSAATQWDGTNAFAMAVMAGTAPIYTSEGAKNVSWRVDCNGTLMPLGYRQGTAERIGVSPVVEGDIAAHGKVEIPLSGTINAGDVVLIAPEVVGFDNSRATTDSTNGYSLYFGRQQAPDATVSGVDLSIWERRLWNMGWFPKVTGL